MKTLNLHGPVIDSDDSWFYDLLEIENINAKSVEEFLDEANGEDIKLSIDSGGGSVRTGSSIYTLLMNYQGKITAEVTGLCASIASVIMLAAEHIAVSPAATIVIHNVWSVNQGDYRDMAKQSDVLKEMSSSIAKMYAKRMGCTLEEAQAAMDEETYYSADQAVEAGIADEKSFEEVKTPLQMMASMDQAFSSDKIAKLKNFMKDQIKNETNNSQEFKLDSEQYQGITDRLDQLISFESEEPNEEPVAKKSNNSAEKPLKNQKFKPLFLGGIK